MLRFSFVVALTAQALGFDSDQRDDLVQRTFVDLPMVVARSQANGVIISNAEGWLRRRALLIGRTMLREERGSPLRDPVTGLHLLDREGRKQWTRGTRIPLEGLGQHAVPSDDEHLDVLDSQLARALLTEALHALESEKTVWGQVLRLHYMEGYSLEEIGIKLGRSHGTIRNDAQKARVRLAGILRERFPRLVVSQTDRSK
jgi:RNA polymerase sigma factor (sigma-70 family)